jgi:tRNA threonylcarbamoyladenosine biosynthesis protein TsaB
VAEPSATLLALDTSTPMGSVAVGTPGALLAEVSLSVRAGHSSALLPAIDFAMGAAGVDRSALGGIVVGGGPGSFTGLRIAAATAKGIAHALRIPLLSYSGLLATAAQAWASPGPVCALFDARGRDVFAACYEFGEDPGGGVVETLPPTVLTLDDVVARYAERPPLFTGDGAIRHAEELVGQTGGRIAPAVFAVPRAACLLWLAGRAPALGRVADAGSWEPEYLRASGAERIAAARAGGAEGGGA